MYCVNKLAESIYVQNCILMLDIPGFLFQHCFRAGAILPPLCSTGILNTTISPPRLKEQSTVLFLEPEQHYLHYAPQEF